MNRTLNTNQTVEIKVLTPVHVGAGTDKNWQRSIDFIHDGGKIYILQQDKLLRLMSEQLLRDYTARLTQGNLREAEKLILQHIDLEEVSSPIFKYDGGDLSNEIKTVIRNGTGIPYIPGSSLKGAIISTLFNFIHKNAGPTKHNKFINDDLLGKMANSIMRYIRTGDALIPTTQVTNVSLFNLYAKGSDWESDYKDGFKISMEHFKAGSTGSFRLSLADGFGEIVRVHEKQSGKVLLPKYYDEVIKEQPAQFLFKIMNDYSREHIRKELEFFEKFDDAPDTDLIINELKKIQALTNTSTAQCVFRMSAGSGFYGITGDWRFKNHISTISQPDQENLTWNQRTRQKEAARYKSRKIMGNGDELSLGFVSLRLI